MNGLFYTAKVAGTLGTLRVPSAKVRDHSTPYEMKTYNA